jgi:uncharacterized protein (DUF885 family)
MYAASPRQAITYFVGKTQILGFLADAKLAEADKFSFRNFDDFLWRNGNVPILLQRWEYLGCDDDLRTLELLAAAPPVVQ